MKNNYENVYDYISSEKRFGFHQRWWKRGYYLFCQVYFVLSPTTTVPTCLKLQLRVIIMNASINNKYCHVKFVSFKCYRYLLYHVHHYPPLSLSSLITGTEPLSASSYHQYHQKKKLLLWRCTILLHISRDPIYNFCCT